MFYLWKTLSDTSLDMIVIMVLTVSLAAILKLSSDLNLNIFGPVPIVLYKIFHGAYNQVVSASIF